PRFRGVPEPRMFAGASCHPFLQSPFVSERGERGLPVDVRPKRGDLAMQLIDPVLDLIPPLLVLPLREVEFPLRRAGRGLPLLVRRFRLLQPVEFLAQAVEVLRLLLKEGAFGLELRGDLPLIPDFGHAGLESLEAGGAVLQGRRRTDPALVLRLEVLRLLRMEFEVRLESAHAISTDLAFLVQASQLLLQTG